MKSLLTKRTLALGLLFFFAFSLRFSFISKGPFHYDALDLALASQKTLETGRLVYESHGTGFPLTVLAGAFTLKFLKFFGSTDPVFSVNFMSVVTGALGVIILFFLVERLFGFRRAIFSAALFSCFGPYVAISTFGKSLTLSICFALASIYYMLRFLEENKHHHFLYSAVFLGFCMAARLSDVLIALPILYIYFSFKPLTYIRIKFFVVYAIIVLFVGGFWYVPLLLDRGLNPFITILSTGSQAQYLGVFSELLGLASYWLTIIFQPSGLILIVAGFLSLIVKAKRKEFFFLLIWFLSLHLFYGNVSSMGLRYLVIAWIPLIIAQGVFLGSLKGKRVVAAGIVVFLIIAVQFIEFAPALEFRHRHALQKSFAEWVAKKTPPDAVIIAMDESLFLRYYGKRNTLAHPITTSRNFMDNYFDNNVDRLLQEGRDVYVISTAFLTYDPKELFREELFNRYDVILVGEHRNEDWHHALLHLEIFNEQLYQLKWKSYS
jgi:predicted membrane-bound mannosyltransferase